MDALDEHFLVVDALDEHILVFDALDEHLLVFDALDEHLLVVDALDEHLLVFDAFDALLHAVPERLVLGHVAPHPGVVTLKDHRGVGVGDRTVLKRGLHRERVLQLFRDTAPLW